ncbi:DNA cytosine methyltransferase [Streptomyces sp. SJ1-7]|nr:DNA cytosine methyltransferase [Streptomyces sp. SJ1-7]
MDRLNQARRLLDRPPTPVLVGQLAAAVGPRIGSVCSGYRGLDMAVEEVFGGTTAWVSDIDLGANAVLAHRWPDVSNLGDLTAVDWSAVEPVDIFCGGYPCQPFSSAGKRKGTADERHIWPWIARALGVLRPRVAVFENVAGHLRLGFDVVLRDLAELGFDVEWCTVRASEVGAPHQRNRLFILATAQDAHREPGGQRRLAAPGEAEAGRARADAGRRGGTPAAHPARLGHGKTRAPGLRGIPSPAVADRAPTVPDADRDAVREQPVGQPGGRGAAVAELAGTGPAADPRRGGLPGHSEFPHGRDTVRAGVRADAPRCHTAPAPHTDRGRRGRTSPTYGRGNPTLAGAVSPQPSTAGNTPPDDEPHGQLTIAID